MALKEKPDLSEFPPISFEEWKEKAEKDLKGRPIEDLAWETEGFGIEPFLNREQVPGKDLADPGKAPYRRGVLPSSNDWRIRVPFTDKDGSEIGKALENGVQCIGLEPANGDRSKIPDEALGAERLELRAEKDPDRWKGALLERKSELPHSGAFLFDPVSPLLREGTWPNEGKDAALQDMARVCENLEKEGLSWHAVPVSSAPFHNAGATLVEELAFTLSLGHDMLAGLLEQGRSIDDLAPRFRFELSAGPLFFPEIAKIRAFRQLWSRIVEAYQPEHTCTKAPWVAGSTSWWSLTRRDPYTNMVRKTTESMAAVIGGVQELTVLPFDGAGQEGTELGQRVARNTHHLLKEESQLNKVIDPAGGSYYLEKLTDRIGEAAWDLVRELEEQGGFFKALEKGSVQARIEASRQERQRAIEHEERFIVGVNAYRDEEASVLPRRSDEDPKPPKGKYIEPLPVERGAIFREE
jgi:methylmalonyl-CoA mutase